MLLIEYPKCTTCSRAKRWLDDHGADYQTRHIKEENPTYEELKEWYPRSGLPIKRLFNTSGLIYRSMGLSQLLEGMSEDGKLHLLAGEGMLIRRPILVTGDQVLFGFDEERWARALRGQA